MINTKIRLIAFKRFLAANFNFKAMTLLCLYQKAVLLLKTYLN